MTPITIDSEFKSLIPSLSPDEYQQLEANIKAEGCRDALVIWAGKNVLLDGHNRYEICQRHGLPYRTVEREFDSRELAYNWIIENQLGRRNLTAEAISYLRGKRYMAEKKPRGGDKRSEQSKDQSDTLVNVAEKLATELKVSVPTIKRDATFAKAVDKLAAVAGDGVRQSVLSRETPITKRDALQLAKVAEKEPERAKALVARVMSEKDKSPTAVIAEIRREEKRETVQEQAWAIGKYNVVYADPPWRYEHVKTENRAIENQYPTMALKDICNLPVSELCADDVVLFMWATSPKLEEAMQVVKAWGFTYRTCAVWVKDKIGMGYYFRQKHELLLVATRGNLPVPEPGDRLSSVIEAPRGRHSEKPDTFYEIIEQLYPNYPKIELFSRNVRTGWQGWGNEYAAAA